MDESFIKFFSNQFITKSQVTDFSVCFCGSEKNFVDCCKVKQNLWISDKYVSQFLGFASSKQYTVTRSEVSFLLKNFESHFFTKWDSCSNPHCSSKETIDSHVFGKKHIEKYLVGSKCKIRNFYDMSQGFFTEIHAGKPITYKLFCESCEKLFQKIDKSDHFVFQDDNPLLHILRTQAYQYQFVRMDLAFNHQFHLVIQKPLETNRKNFNGNSHVEVKLEVFDACYRRYKSQSFLRDKLWDLYHRGAGIPYLYKRVINTKNGTFFAGGIANPSHDLRKNKILFVNEASLFYFIVPESQGTLAVIIGSFDKEYQDMINQFKSLNDFVFKSYINHLCTSLNLPLSAIFSSSFEPTKSVLDALIEKNQLSLNVRQLKPSDLESRRIFAKFIK